MITTWKEEWILIEDVVQNKLEVTAILFSDIQRIEVKAKPVDGKEKRTYNYTMKDGSAFSVPDEAVITSAPREYYDLVAEISRAIKV